MKSNTSTYAEIVSRHSEGSRAGMRGKMRLGLLLFISKLKNRAERPLAEISHYVISYSFALNVPKVGFSVILHFSAAGEYH